MAQKITSKNLSYDDSLPPFLARLRNQHAAAASEPDPILAARRRGAKPRSASEEAEDGPLVVDEDGVTVTGVTVGKDGAVVEQAEEEGGDRKEGEEAEKGKEKEEKMAAIGGGRKRKVGKVVGGHDEEGEEELMKEGGKVAKKGEGTAKGKKNDQSKDQAKGKKKTKKIKLSFGDEDGD